MPKSTKPNAQVKKEQESIAKTSIMAPPSLGLSTSCLFPLGTKSTFQAAEILGYKSVEIMISQQAVTRDYVELDNFQQQYQIPIISLHAPTLILTHFTMGTHPGGKLRKTAELATKLGAKTVVVHPPFNYQKKYAKEFLELVNSLEQEIGIAIAVENMFPWKAAGRIKEMYLPSWQTITESPLVNNLTYDFSHAALSGLDTLDEIERHMNKIQHVHFCDGHGIKVGKKGIVKDKIFDEHLIPGLGSQPVKEAIQLLTKSNWNGNVVAEINTRRYTSLDKKLPMLEKTKAFFDSCHNS